MSNKYEPIERYLRSLPTSQEEVTVTFEFIEQILSDQLPVQARTERDWWSNQKRGTIVESVAWMDAGWLVETVNLKEKRVSFVRQ